MAIVAKLRDALPDVSIIDDRQSLHGYRQDQTPTLTAGHPAAAVFPRTREDVVTIVQACAQEHVPLVVRGAGSGLAGAANAVDGCVVVVTTRMDQIHIDQANLTATVQPGALTGDLARQAASVGLWYRPDPASRDFCTIGGNIATNAGGLCCVKYGVTRHSVLGLEVVLSDGTVTRVGGTTIKNVAGLDLVGLFVGSEGTLGVVTEASLRLYPERGHPQTMVATFDSVEAAGQAVSRLRRQVVPALLEIMDRTTLEAVERYRPTGLQDTAALVLAQTDTHGQGSPDELRLMEDACQLAGATFTATTSDPDEGEMMLHARRYAYTALEAMGTTLLDDVGVRIADLPALLAGIDRIARQHEVTIGTFGHAGDGNMHPTIVYDAATEQERAHDAFDAIVRLTLDLGGTISGEHGIGRLKRSWLDRSLDAGARELHSRIKRALDPDGILNPGAGTPAMGSSA